MAVKKKVVVRKQQSADPLINHVKRGAKVIREGLQWAIPGVKARKMLGTATKALAKVNRMK